MWIMVAGPYRAGATTAAARAENLTALNNAALALLRAGHVPIIGVNMALPMIEAAAAGAAAYNEIMMPVSLALADRCDACLRVGGPSRGADDEVKRFEEAGRPIYRAIGEVPGVIRPGPAPASSGMDFVKAANVRRELGLDGITTGVPAHFDDPAFSRQVLGLDE